MIEFKNVSIKYKQNIVINNFSCQLNGSMYYLVGENGSGKTTLANVLYKEKLDYEGEIFIDGIELRTIKTNYLRRNIISYLTQENSWLNNYSLMDILNTYVCDYDIDKFEYFMSLLHVNGLEEQNFSFLSGGEKQKCLIIVALLKSTKFIIMDEFENNLDLESLQIVQRLVKEEEKVFIIISHYYKKSKELSFVTANEKNILDKNIINKKLPVSKLLKLNYKKNIPFRCLFTVLLICIISLQLLMPISYFKTLHETYTPAYEFAKETNPTSMLIYTPAEYSYASAMNYNYTIDDNIDNLYFEEQDYKALQESSLVSSVTIVPGIVNTENAPSYNDQFVLSNEEYEFYNMLFPKSMVEDFPSYFITKDLVYGNMPEDSSNEVIIPLPMAQEYSSDVESLIGEEIKLSATDINTDEVVELSFVVSGIYDNGENNRVYYSYHEDSIIARENQYYYALEDNPDIASDIYQNAYDHVAKQVSQVGGTIEYQEFVNGNSDLIEGFYVQTTSSESVSEITDKVLEVYPNAVIISQEMLSTHPPMINLIPILKEGLKLGFSLTICLILLILILFFGYNVKREEYSRLSIFMGYKKRSVIFVRVFETSVVVLLAASLVVMFSLYVNKTAILYPSYIIYLIAIIIIDILLIEIFSLISYKIKQRISK